MDQTKEDGVAPRSETDGVVGTRTVTLRYVLTALSRGVH